MLTVLALNTNIGKRVLAYVGILDCYELTLTGEVVCGDEGEKLQGIKENANEASQDLREESQVFDKELDADSALLRRNILSDDTSFSEADGYTVKLKTTGFLGTTPDRVCDVLNEGGFTPALVVDSKSGETTSC